MPVADPSDDDDFLQQFLAGHQAGQAYGANQAYGPGGIPGPYSGGPQGQLPGGGVMNRLQTTPGAPSMGYPGMGAPQQAGPPQTGAPATAGLSLMNNPLVNGASRALNYFNPISSAQAQTAEPGVWNMRHGMPAGPDVGGMLRGVLNAASQGQPTDSNDLIGGPAPTLPKINLPTGAGLPSSADAAPYLANAPTSGYTPISHTPAAPTTANPAPVKRTDAAYGPYNAPPSAAPIDPFDFQRGGSAGASANPARRPASPSFVGSQPGSGAPTGAPSQTPAVAGANNRFVQIDRPDVDPLQRGRMGNPQMTALNLAGLFGGRGQAQPAAAANPANVAAPNAQPVSGPMPQAAVNHLAANFPGVLSMSQDQLANYMRTQPWLKNLGAGRGQIGPQWGNMPWSSGGGSYQG